MNGVRLAEFLDAVLSTIPPQAEMEFEAMIDDPPAPNDELKRIAAVVAPPPSGGQQALERYENAQCVTCGKDLDTEEETNARLAPPSGGWQPPLEQELRKEWWLNHGIDCAPYGDDGEMQCCMVDFKRMPLDELRTRVDAFRTARLSAVVNQDGSRESYFEILRTILNAPAPTKESLA